MKLLRITLITSVLLLSGCVYHPPFSQGNILSPTKIAQIRNGMSPTQVVGILGTPVLENVYYNNHLVYVYTFKPSHRTMTENKMIITFVNNRVSDIESDFPRS